MGVFKQNSYKSLNSPLYKVKTGNRGNEGQYLLICSRHVVFKIYFQYRALLILAEAITDLFAFSQTITLWIALRRTNMLCPEVKKLFSSSKQLSMNISLLTNIKMATRIVGIFIFISKFSCSTIFSKKEFAIDSKLPVHLKNMPI